MGAALCVYSQGKPVIDIRAGQAAPSRPWEEKTISVVFSCTKGLVSILAAMLVQRGLLDYAAPVARYWPEFAAAGKAEVTVAEVLSHRAGLSAPREDLTEDDLLEWGRMTDLLAAQEPLWKPGSAHVYHTITHGWLAGEIVRRAAGKAVGAQFADMIAGPLRADAWIGLPPSENARVAQMQIGRSLAEQTSGPVGADEGARWLNRAATMGGALPLPLVGEGVAFNDPRFWRAEIPGAGGIASAHALAKVWSATVTETDGVRLLYGKTIERATVVQSEGEPHFPVQAPWPRWGMGLQLDSGARRYVTERGFGHDGAGGQVAFAEPELGIGFAYLTNLMEGAGDTRATSVVDALRRMVA
jgi:CubicO group peptidase (beta-lactamase class C family)